MKKELINAISKIEEIAQLDFERDNELFIDPYRLNELDGELAKRAKQKILGYFDLFFKYVKEKDEEGVKRIGRHLHEINATKLGYTDKSNKPSGKGFCQRDLLFIFYKATQISDEIEDMPDILILSDRVGPDKVSDLTTNIIYEELLEFTKSIINKYKLDVEFENRTKYIFNIESQNWEKKNILIPLIDNEEILFLPKKIVATYEIFSYQSVYHDLVFPFYKIHTAIHNLVRFLKDGSTRPDCKKIMKKYPNRRATVEDFKNQYPKEYKNYKNNMIKDYWRQEIKKH